MYHHTQTGKWIIFIFGILAIVLLVMWFLRPSIYPALVVALGIMATLLFFGSLTVVGDNEQLSFYFGIGIIRRKFRYSNLLSIRKVRNKWYWGWGIRWFGRGWLYNVSGLYAVELIFKNGKVLRIGTNDPDALLRFVEARLRL